MHCVYILKSKADDKLYIGYTNNIKKRLAQHNTGKVTSTKSRRPFKLIYCESYLAEEDARRRERFLKTGWGRRYINRNLKDTLLC